MKYALALVAFLCSSPWATAGDWCQGATSLLRAGRDSTGYYLRTDESSPYGAVLPKGAGIQPSVDALARLTNATVVYLGDSTQVRLTGQWRAHTAFAALKALADAGGLAAVAAKPDFWIVGQPEFVNNDAVRIFVYPIDPSGQRTSWATNINEVERALVAQLPDRLLGYGSRVQQLFLGYYWLPGGGGNELLAIATEPSEAIYQPATVFRVTLAREEGQIHVDCVWGIRTSGDLLFGIDEDFDGDGHRDFVFRGSEDWPDEVISGEDGHVLARMFSTVAIAVEEKGAGVKRFAGGDAWETPGSGSHVFQYSQEDRAFHIPGLKPTRQDRQAMLAEAQKITREVAAATKPPERDPVKVLAAAVGGTENIRLYIFPGMSGPPHAERSGAQVIRLPNSNTPMRIEAGYPQHVLYEYKSPGYLAQEEKQR